MTMPASPPLFALYASPMNVGGIESVYGLIARALLERGWRVDLLTKAGDEVYRSRRPAGARSVTVGRPASWSLFRYLRSRRPAVVMSAKPDCNVELLAARALPGAAAGTSIVVRYDAVLDDDHYAPVRGPRPGRALGRFLTRRLLGRADVAIAVSDGLADAVRRRYPGHGDRLVRLYNPVDAGRIRELARAPAEHPWLRDPDPADPPVILHVGRLAPEKDLPTLLRAFARARRERPLRLALAGIGPEDARLREEARRLGIAADVSFAGYVENQYALMARAPVFAMSSVAEGLGCVLQEAMVCGASIVSTDYRYGARELLEDGRHGVLVPTGDTEALARGMLRALDRPPDRTALLGRGLEFDVGPHVDRLLALCRPDAR